MTNECCEDNCSCCSHWSEWLYTVFRIIIGGLFLWHGIVKFPGATGMFMAAGIIEIVVGALVLLGLYTRYAAALGALLMVAALAIAHLGKGLVFVGKASNGGETALLFFAAFLAMYTIGSGKFALGNVLGKSCDSCGCQADESCECGHDHESESEAHEAPAHKAAKKKSHK